MEEKDILTRALPFTFDSENNSLEVVFSSGERTKRRDVNYDLYIEELEISESAIDFTRINKGAPVLKDHLNIIDNQIGITERGWISGNEAIAKIKLSSNPLHAGTINDIKDSIIKNVSVGYRVLEYKQIGNEGDLKVLLATKWEPVEISFVPVPVDKNTQTRKLEEKEIKMEDVKEPQVDIDALVRAETLRVTEISTIGRKYNLDENVIQKFIDEKSPVDEVRKLALDDLSKKINTNLDGKNIKVVTDSKENFVRGLEDAILIRSKFKQDDAQNEFRGYTLLEMAKRNLELDGLSLRGDKMDIIGRAFTSTSDFPNILLNVANKFVKKGFDEAEVTYDKWTTSVNVSDFKPQSFVALSEFGNLDLIPENKEYKSGTFSDTKETVQIGTYGKMFPISRQALINDDLNAFTNIPQKMGNAAKRTINATVYARLLASTVMSDGYAIFATEHANTGSGAITVANIDAGAVVMAKQKDISGSATLNIRPNVILTPVSLERTAKLYMLNDYDPAANKFQVINTVRGLAEVVSDPLLDVASTAIWYLIAKQYDAFVVGFLDGNQTPVVESRDGWNIDGTEFKVRLDWGVACLDYRPLYKSTGV